MTVGSGRPAATDPAPDGDAAAAHDAPDADAATEPSPERGRAATAGGRRAAKLDPDALAALEDERDFLLRSLDDLERERAAGDVDEHDYETLKDDYTVRAARTIRAIDSHQARLAAARRPRAWRRTLGVAAGIAVFAVLAGVLVAQASGRRESGDALTGEIRETTRSQLVEARGLAQQQRFDEALEAFDEVLATQPDNAEALAYRGWTQYLSGDAAGAADSLTAALQADPEYADTFAFLAIILSRSGAPEEALDALDRFEALDPPREALDLVGGLRTDLERQVAEAGDTPATGTPPATNGTPGPATSPTSTPVP